MDRTASEGQDARKGSQKHDESIMNTNNSCIVSKRSVEKTYHNDSDGFLRHFVKKFQRRSPLINRGYWLRMRAIEGVIKSYLRENEDQSKLIVNLGCGYDTLPFKLIAQEKDLCKHVCFVDVDYADLMSKKCKVIRETPQLSEVIGESGPGDTGVLLESKEYIAVACDLQSSSDLHRLRVILNNRESPIFFVAEVSMTYMNTRKADAVIQWASTFKDGHFCLLEQYLPDGPSHPFTETMLNHFKRLQSPLQAATQHQSLEAQTQRFRTNGWPRSNISSLWDLWSNDDFISPDQRNHIDEIEPFDEWEEFALFASHYFVLMAGESRDGGYPGQPALPRDDHMPVAQGAPLDVDSGNVTFKPHGRVQAIMRRQGASFLHNQSSSVVFHGGQGKRSRLKDSLRLCQQTHKVASDGSQRLHSPPIIELTCHTFTTLKDGSALLVGGRTSPANASRSCFLCRHGQWLKVDDLPFGLYRHSAVACGSGVLVFGGKTDSRHVSSSWLFWEHKKGWQEVKCEGGDPGSRFGMCMLSLDRKKARMKDTMVIYHGLLFGGINEKGAVCGDPYLFTLTSRRDGPASSLECTAEPLKADGDRLQTACFERFGAQITKNGEQTLVVGGIGSAGTIDHELEILQLNSNLKCALGPKLNDPRSLLVGFEVQALPKDGFTIIFGGGAVCFSFGTFWNPGMWHFGSKVTEQTQFNLADFTIPENPRYAPKGKAASSARGRNNNPESVSPPTDQREPLLIPKIRLRSSEQFLEILRRSEPVVIEALNIGPCVDKWTNEYLKTRLGFDREVIVHKSPTQQMSFLDKNFTYTKQPFWDFIESIERGEASYLRSVSSTAPADRATKLGDDFPTIADDFTLPTELEYVSQKVHSSPLRISGPVAMWLHYDVMANVLCQVRGCKRLLLYHPGDVSKLGFPPGASSSRLNAFDENTRRSTSIGDAQAYVAQLETGDVLFIPAFWAHTAKPTGGDISVAVNVFFRHLQQNSYSAGKDVYGNRDLQAYENGRKDLQRMTRAFEGLPEQASRFYLGRLADELEEVIASWGGRDDFGH
ncbi:MAG: tRNA methyltransferase ppm2 [Alyxoria varia]|nr:MAG: tRNA methyltransferase ppm2 [Alyxoria varia]